MNRKKLLICGVALLLIAGGGGYLALRDHVSRLITGGDVHGQTTDQTPTFRTLLPDGKSIDQLGGWHRVSPPSSDPAYAYVDKLDDITVTVTQQKIPASFIDDVESHVSDLATNYDATDKLTAGSTTVYVGASAKGPQSVIFTKSGLLILIKSDAAISNKSWISYITSLR